MLAAAAADDVSVDKTETDVPVAVRCPHRGRGGGTADASTCVVTSIREGVVFPRYYYALAAVWRVLSRRRPRREGAGAVDQG